ncbi:MAG TPA: AEC family transporter [Geminicoccaceae bacterium]|nr:AEC family transporter [Geminicoccaceae bacterium]
MTAILNAVVPLFAVILFGFAAGRIGLLAEAGVRGIVTFVFAFAIPSLLFRLMAGTDVREIAAWSFVGACFLAEAAVFVAGMAVGGLLFGMRLAGMTIQGFGSAFSNGVLLTLPLLLSIYGDRGALPALPLITLDVLTFALITLLLEIARGGAGGLRVTGQIVRSILTHPILMAMVAGLLFALTDLPLPTPIERTLAFVGQAAAPAALFALGATLSLRRIAGGLGPAGVMVAFKLALHPALVWLAVATLTDADRLWLNAAVLFAASPVGVNVYVFAQHYDANVESASTAILISTALAMLTLTGLLLVLPPVGP